MEILNNIWGALSTENEGLIKLLAIFFIVPEAYLCFLIFTSVLKINYTKKQCLIYVICMAIAGNLSLRLFAIPINTIVNYVILFFVIRYLFKLPLLKTFLAIIIPFFIFTIVGNLIFNPIIKFFNIATFVSDNIPLHRITYVCILFALIGLVVLVLKIKNTRLELLDYIQSNNKNIIFINLFFGIFTLFLQFIITVYYINVLPLYITFLSTISFIFYFSISFLSLNHILKLQKTTTDLENAESYNKTLSFLYDNVKGFKHDFDDIVNMIGGYVRTDDLEGLKKYYLELESDYEKVKNIATLNPTLINNPGIYNLLVSKYKKANEYGVKMQLDYFFDFDRINMPIYQFSRMFGILLDNAIEAAKNCDEKEVNISFRDSSSNKTQIIIVENTYSNKDVDTSKIFEKGVSEKKDHMGMGLWEVNQIIMKNNNIHLVTTKDNKHFKQQLEIYY